MSELLVKANVFPIKNKLTETIYFKGLEVKLVLCNTNRHTHTQKLSVSKQTFCFDHHFLSVIRQMTFEVLEIFTLVVNGHMICDLHENREVLKRKSSCSITRDCKIGSAELAAKPNSMSGD